MGPLGPGGCHSPMVSDHEHNGGQLAGLCHALRGLGVTRSVVSMVSEAAGVGRVSRAWVRGLPWSPLMSEMVRVRDLHGLRS